MLEHRLRPASDALLRLPGVRRLLSGPQLNQLTRLAPVLALIREAGGRELLDAGSGSRGAAPWLPGWQVTALDTSFDDYGAASGPRRRMARPVIGDVRAIPFEDRAFDVVLALDVLEHLAPADRGRALGELARVAGRRLIVACPAGEAALACDRRLAETLPRPPGWLAEHIATGFPSEEELLGLLAPYGEARLEPNEHVASHERLVRAELSPLPAAALRVVALVLSLGLRIGGPARGAAGALLRLLRGRDRAPAYRAVVVVDRPAA